MAVGCRCGNAAVKVISGISFAKGLGELYKLQQLVFYPLYGEDGALVREMEVIGHEQLAPFFPSVENPP